MIQINNKTLCEYCFEETDREPCPHCGFSREAYVNDPMVLAVGNILENRYIVGGVIGKGGFGITYLAYDKKLDRKVAVKEYYPYGLAMRNLGSTFVSTVSGESVEMFKGGADKFYDEARLVAKFNDNPNIVSVYDFFYGNDTVYFTMGFLRGQTLKSYIRDHGVLTAGQTVQVAKDVTNALLAAHHLNVLHRDISPDNIMVCSDGTIKLLDFGAARQVLTEGSQSLSVILKQGFAPLEQYQKKGKQGPWTDIYALGATMYYALTLDLLDDPMSRLEDDSEYSSNIHGIDEALWKIIHKATMLRSSERYSDIRKLQEALEALPIRPEALAMSEDSADKVKFEPASGTSHSLSGGENTMPGMAETVGYAEAGGATVPVSETAGATMPVSESVGATQALHEDVQSVGATQALHEDVQSVGATQALHEDVQSVGATQALHEDVQSVGATQALQENVQSVGVTQALKEEADTAQKSNAGIQTSVVAGSISSPEEKPVGKKKISRKLLLCIAAAAGVLAVFLLVLVIRFFTADFRYETYSDHVVITEYRGNDKEVEIPSEIGGKPVTEIGVGAFFECSSLTSVEIPDSVKKIGEDAFYNCNSLTRVIIPDSVTEIGVLAFSNCSSLTSVEIPVDVTMIVDCTFSRCSSLTSVKIPDGVTEIGMGAFSNCSSLTSVEIPDSVTEIGEEAFKGCESLTSVTIPEYTTVAENAFENCPNVTITRAGDIADMNPSDNIDTPQEGGSGEELPEVTPVSSFDYLIMGREAVITGLIGPETDIVIPDEIEGCPVTKIDEHAFYESSITSVAMPDSVTEIGAWSFCNCKSLTNIRISNSVTMIWDFVFDGCSSLNDVIIPDSVTMISGYAFDNCTNLTRITIPEHTEVDEHAFGENSNVTITRVGSGTAAGPELPGTTPVSSFDYTIKNKKAIIIAFTGLETDVVIPREIEGYPVKEIEGSAFWGSLSLKSVVIPDSVTRIGSYAFMNCDAMVSVTIPDGVKKIEDHAFANCSSLKSVIIPDSVMEIGEEAFSCANLTSVILPENTIVNSTAFGKRVTVAKVSSVSEYLSAFQYTIEDNKVIITEYSGDETDVVIPREIEGFPVTEIGDTAFYLCRDITSVIIPDSVTKIDYGAFWDCNSLMRIEIPDSVTSIEMSAFVSCQDLLSVEIPNSVTSIGDYAFRWCLSLTSVVIPDSVTEIGEGAFDGCRGLTNVIVPEHTTVAASAFDDCPNVNVTRVSSTAGMTP